MKMTTQEYNPHWTSDPDLVERYVLNRIDSAERSQLGDHLQVCEECARVVRTEEVLIAGIRAHGRAALKSRLKERFATRRGREFSWYQLAGAAAAIVVLITVGVHNRWFMTEGVQQSPETLEMVQEEQSVPLREQTDAEKRDDGVLMDQRGDEARRRVQRSPTVSPGQGRGAPQLQMKYEGAPAPVAESVSPRGPVERYSLSAKPAPLSIMTLQKNPEVWLEGRILEGRSRPSQGLDRQDRAEEESKKKAAEMTGVRTSRDRARMVEDANQQEGLQLFQRPLADLPQSQQATRSKDSESVPALLERSDSLAQLTLFLDPLHPETDLDRAAIEQVTGDSIVIGVGAQRIGFKIPRWVNVPLHLHKGKR